MDRLWAVVDQGSPTVERSRHPYLLAVIGGGVGLALARWLVPAPGLADSHILVTSLLLVAVMLSVAGEVVIRTRARARRDLWRLRQREVHLQSIFDTVPAALLVVEEDGHVLTANRCAATLFGRSIPQLARASITELIAPADTAPSGSWDRAAARAERDGTTVTGMRADGAPLDLAIATSATHVGDRRLRLVYLRDQTARKRAEEQVAELQAEVQQLSRASALGQLGAAIAHELNQPMAAAALYAGALKTMLANGATAEAGDTVERMLAQLFRASAVLRRLREFVGGARPLMEWVDAAALVAEAADLVRLAVRQVGAELLVEVEPTIDQLFVDRVQVQQVLLNLVLNAVHAVKGREQREIRLAIRAEDLDQVRVTLSDSGHGVPRELRAKLFKPFSTGKRDGLGVGLAISRSIIEAHGGRMWYEDTERGARFHFTLRHRLHGGLSDAA